MKINEQFENYLKWIGINTEQIYLDEFGEELEEALTPEEMALFNDRQYDKVLPLVYMWNRFSNEDGTFSLVSTYENRDAMSNNGAMTRKEVDDFEKEITERYNNYIKEL